MAVEPEEGGKLAHGRLQSTLPVRAKTRRQTITSDGTPGLLCLSNPGRGQSAIFVFLEPYAHDPIRIGDERERLVTASPVMTKNRAPAGGNNYPENDLVKPPRRDTRALSPAGMCGEKAPLRLAAQKEQTARAISAHAQCACLLSLQMGSIN